MPATIWPADWYNAAFTALSGDPDAHAFAFNVRFLPIKTTDPEATTGSFSVGSTPFVV